MYWKKNHATTLKYVFVSFKCLGFYLKNLVFSLDEGLKN